MTNELDTKRWHRAFSIQRRLDLIETARTHPDNQDFPGKIMFDTIRQLAEIADEQEQRILGLEAQVRQGEEFGWHKPGDDELIVNLQEQLTLMATNCDKYVARLVELESRRGFDDFDDEPEDFDGRMRLNDDNT